MIIYKIVNMINGKIYVGQTNATLKIRFDNHVRSKHCTNITTAIKKYGAEYFKILPLETAKDRNEALKKEKKWIKKLNCFHPNGYNVNPFGNKGEKAHRVHQIICLENEEKYWGSYEAARELNLDPSSVIKVLKGKLKQTKGYSFEYCDKKLNPMKEFKTQKTSKFKGVSLDKRTGKWISVIHPNRKSIYIGSFETEKEAAIAYNEASLKYFGDKAVLNRLAI